MTAAPEAHERARLFARVLDLPGGMRIGTIHAFCQSLLRRFPLEAGLSPHFELAEDADARARLREAREQVLAQPDHRDAIFALAAETDEQCFAALTEVISNGQNDITALLRAYQPEGLAALQRAVLNAGETPHDTLMRAAVNWEREQHIERVLRHFEQAGTPTGRQWASETLQWLAHETEDRVLAWFDWVKAHFTTAGTRRKLTKHYGTSLAALRDELQAEIDTEHDRIEAVEEKRRAAKLCEINRHLTQLIAPVLGIEAAEKKVAARLSYNDLIAYSGELLKDPGAAWILYKLDGGIDHLLLDEVQDTAPAQWRIADAIAQEFFAGEGAKAVPRSIFAVGDAKQSIFSFQGADLDSFETYRDKFRARVTDSGHRWLDGALSVSFRSTAPVLALVDAVFADGPARHGVCAPGATLRHGVSRTGQAGAVTLWPLTQAAEPPELPPWAVPADYAGADSAKAILARDIAAHIRAVLDAGTPLASRGRPAEPGDFLILVRRRDELFTAITAACKALQVPIAGADQMELLSQQAVSDLLALCDALLLPEDDLAFGQYLASPLGGLTDDSLMQLALGRYGRSTLAQALQARRAEQPDWAAAWALFETLRARVDFTTPYALLAELLGVHGGRARLLRRLGSEAAEPIDELLAEALAHGQREAASLQAFVHGLRRGGTLVKRQGDAAGGVVRIMTVHGAKGLQAPIVILPDTAEIPRQQQNQTLFWLRQPQQPQQPQLPEVAVPVFCPRAALRSQAVEAARLAEQQAALAEYNRLLYVALTRAEDELLICGAGGKRAMPPESWYATVQAAFQRLPGAVRDGASTVLRAPQTAVQPDRGGAATAATTAAKLPGWAGAAPDWAMRPPPAETARPEPLAPSRSADDDTKRAIAASPLGGGGALARGAREAALAKGRAVHALLQHLPDLPEAAQPAAAAGYLDGLAELDAAARQAILAAAMALLRDPALAALFGPGSRAEVPLAGVVGDVEIGGLVDRLAVLPDQVLLADYKTDRTPPASAAAIPAAYLRQLAAYAAILRQIHPDRPVHCRLIFTETAAVLPVPADHLAGYAPAPAQPYAA